jgi:hypothetical protein
MQPEAVELCSYCIKLVSGHDAITVVDHWPTLGAFRKSKDTCTLCSALHDTFKENVGLEKSRLPDIWGLELLSCPITITVVDIASSEAGLISQTLILRLDLPDRGFLYSFYFTLGSCNSNCE